MKLCGIYKIYNNKTNKVYIGSSVDIKSRIRQHKNQLFKNIHGNIHLQRAFNLYGIESFEFSIIENCKESDKVLLENKYIKQYQASDKEYGYNICEIAGKPAKRIKPEDEINRFILYSKTREYSDQDREQMSRSHQKVDYSVITLISPDNKEYKIFPSINEFCKNNSISPKGVIELIKGNIKQHKGWKINKDEEIYKPIYNIVDPDNKSFLDITNLSRFCKEHNLKSDTCNKVLKNKNYGKYKGWEITRSYRRI